VPVSWTFNLAVSQLIFVPAFTLWRWLVKFDDGKDEEPIVIDIEFERGPIQNLSEISRDEEPWMEGSDVSIGERDNLTKSRKWREQKQKKYIMRYATGAEMLRNMKDQDDGTGNKKKNNGRIILAHKAFPIPNTSNLDEMEQFDDRIDDIDFGDEIVDCKRR